MNEEIFRRLESFVSQGRVVLFTGAGFSLGAQNRAGVQLPTTVELTQKLWEIGFPDEPYDESNIQDVFEASVLQARTQTIDLLNDRLSVDAGSLPDYYTRWFSLPWHRIYTLNIDNLADTVNRASELPRQLRIVSALSDTVPSSSADLTVVHLNGYLEDLPEVTFSGRQYAERLATSDVWYTALARELASHPIIFIGTTLDEPPLWQYVEDRGRPTARARDLRPGSILVSPKLKKARAVALHQYRIDWIAGTAESFADEVLQNLQKASREGHALLRHASERDAATVVELTTLSTGPLGDEREFLRGLEPRWSDITDGYAIERCFDKNLKEKVEADQPKLIILTGTAGTGKSTSAMRLVLWLQSAGSRSFVVNEDGDLRPHKLRNAIAEQQVGVLFIPNLDRLGRNARGTLDDILESHPELIVISSVRSPWYQGNQLANYIEKRTDAIEAVVPHLADDDIDALLDALAAASRLGALKGKTRTQQRQVMTSKCDRQLLVAMIEATSGERFDARIESECRELGAEAALIYGVSALATNFRIRITNADLLAAVGGEPADQMRLISELERTHLLVRQNGSLQLRHRVIAERAVDFYRASRMVESPLRGLVFALAAACTPGELRKSSAGRGLIRLINHKLLIEFLRTPEAMEGSRTDPDTTGIRGVYEEVEDLLTHDFHYWLQRGSFETEVGNLDLAHNFIEQARGLAPDDPFVRTQWAYMTLKRASRRVTDPDSSIQVENAFGELDDQIVSRGKKDVYPFHIYGSQGLAWASRAPLVPDEKKVLLQKLRTIMDEGRKLHPGDRELKKLAKDVDTTYFSLAVAEE